MASHVAIGVPTEVLIAPEDFSRAFTARSVAEALWRGLAASGQPARVSPDVDGGGQAPPVPEIRAARAVITGMGCLDRHGLTGTLLSEVATSARQSGVPCHAVVGSNRLDLFELRILDLQFVLEASTLAAIEAAGAAIGVAIRSDTARGA
ncbi:MAG TPA: glycerate kinase [Solirubrobacteraceae bacterium]|nr:glycerate kinase [Solirubrobacteraceae bacterium]